METRRKQQMNLIAIFLTAAMLLTGCAAMHTSIAKKDLVVQTRMSESVFLDPVAASKRVVFIQVRNTSDKQNFNVDHDLKAAIAAKGYRVVDDPEKAHYMLLVQVLSVSKTTPEEVEGSLGAGYGGVFGGAAAGALAGSALGSTDDAFIGAGVGALVGGIAETIANAAVQDVLFMALTDIQISERTRQGVVGKRDTQIDTGQGVGGKVHQTFSETVKDKRYRTRIVSTANKVNLKYEEAAPELRIGLVRSLSGLF